MERAVERGLERRDLEALRYLGLDEKSFAKGQSHVSVMTDLEAGRVLEVMDGADQQAAEMLLATLPDEVLERLEAVCLDMGASYRAAAESQLPGVAIGHDRFHILAHLNDAVATVHRQENAILKEKGRSSARRNPAPLRIRSRQSEPGTGAAVSGVAGRRSASFPGVGNQGDVPPFLELSL